MGAASCSDAERAPPQSVTRGLKYHGKPDALPAGGKDLGTAQFWHDKMRISVASQAVFDAAQAGDARRVATALNAHGDPNCANAAGYTALMLASGVGFRVIIGMLLQAKANPNYSLGGLTPLMIASSAGNVEVVRMLVNCGASILVATQDQGWTSLHKASQRGHATLVRLLIQAASSVDAGDWKGRTPMMLASIEGHSEALQALISCGASTSLVDREGETSMIKCVRHNREVCLDVMLRSGTPVNVGNRHTGDAAITVSSQLGQESCCRMMLQYHANVNWMNQRRDSPLMMAADGGFSKVTQLLSLACADSTLQDLQGWTALMRAAAAGKSTVCHVLLDFGGDPSLSSAIDGNTALTLAAAGGHAESYSVLINAGATVRAVDDGLDDEGD